MNKKIVERRDTKQFVTSRLFRVCTTLRAQIAIQPTYECTRRPLCHYSRRFCVYLYVGGIGSRALKANLRYKMYLIVCPASSVSSSSLPFFRDRHTRPQNLKLFYRETRRLCNVERVSWELLEKRNRLFNSLRTSISCSSQSPRRR